jgi:hypothetical protein
MKTINCAYIRLAFDFANDAKHGDPTGWLAWQAAYWLGKGLGGTGVYLD